MKPGLTVNDGRGPHLAWNSSYAQRSSADNTHAKFLTGAVVVGFLLAFTRWGSYLGTGGLFLTDAILLVTLIHHIVDSIQRGKSNVIGSGSVVLAAFLVWGAARAITSPWPFALTTLRDLAPYFYAVLGVLAARSLVGSTEADRQKSARFIVWSLRIHLWWFSLVTLVPEIIEHTPLIQSTVRFLSPRPDVDVALVGVYAAWLLLQALRDGEMRPTIALSLVFSWTIIFQGGTRAGLLGAATALIFALWVAFRSSDVTVRRKLAAAALIPLLTFPAVALFPQSAIGQRLQATFQQSPSTPGAGTASARANAWPLVIDYVSETNTRLLVGVGFGPNFMVESGAEAVMLGEESQDSTRSPHNYWLGTLARLGSIGVFFFGLVLAVTLRRVWQLRLALAAEPLLFLSATLCLALIAPFSFGVVLEAPFGAIPFFWAVGLLLAAPKVSNNGLEGTA